MGKVKPGGGAFPFAGYSPGQATPPVRACARWPRQPAPA